MGWQGILVGNAEGHFTKLVLSDQQKFSLLPKFHLLHLGWERHFSMTDQSESMRAGKNIWKQTSLA